MRLMFTMAVVALMALASPASAQDASRGVGEVERARGPALVTRAILELPATAGRTLLADDVLSTGADARLHARLIDDSRLMLGADARLTVDEMVLDGAGSGVMLVTRGAFRMVSGTVNDGAGTLDVVTPVAHIGVRGTDFWGEQTADKLTLALLDAGELTVTTEQGVVTLNRPNQAVVIEKGQAPGGVFTLTPEQLADAQATVAW